jgi:hypothetical protein
MAMRLRRIWFDGLSFFAALLAVGGAVSSIVSYTRDKDARLVDTAFAVGTFLLVAAVFFWMSLRVGDIQRRRRDVSRSCGEHSGFGNTDGDSQTGRK